MNPNFLITTTDTIQNGTIKRYIDTICTNVVVGTNVFSDFAASLTDFFGGRSGTYRNKLESIYSEATYTLKRKAARMGANAIVGFRVDFDEISGKDKSMLMVSVSGTACVVEYLKGEDCSAMQNNDASIIPQDNLDKEIQKASVIRKIKAGEGLDTPDIEFLIEHPQEEAIDNLLDRYISFSKRNDCEYRTNNVSSILNAYPREIITPHIYNKYMSTKDVNLKELIKKINLFDAKSILTMCDVDIHLAIPFLSCKCEYYTKEDLNVMRQIVNVFENLPDTGKIEKVKGGLLGKEQEKYICQKGHKNPIEKEFCENLNCGINIKGLTYSEVEEIEQFKEKTKILESLIK